MSELMQAVIDLHQMARLVDQNIGNGHKLSMNFRSLAHELTVALETKKTSLYSHAQHQS